MVAAVVVVALTIIVVVMIIVVMIIIIIRIMVVVVLSAQLVRKLCHCGPDDFHYNRRCCRGSVSQLPR